MSAKRASDRASTVQTTSSASDTARRAAKMRALIRLVRGAAQASIAAPSTSDLAARVARLNVGWNVSSDTPAAMCAATATAHRSHAQAAFLQMERSPKAVDARFAAAVELVMREFEAVVRHEVESWLPARMLVLGAVSAAPQVYPSGDIVIMRSFCPWHSHIHDIERRLNVAGRTKVVLHPDPKGDW